MKIAHLLIVHKSLDQAFALIKLIASDNHHIFIHADGRIQMEELYIFKNLENVFLIENRVKVHWGGYSLVQATLNSLELIVKTARYDYINFLSGQDYPIKSMKSFEVFLENNMGSQFLEFIYEEERPEVTFKRFYKFNFADFKFHGKYLVQKILNSLIKQRKFPFKDWRVVWKSQWMMLSGDCVDFVLKFSKENTRKLSYFKYVWGVDEFYFQMLIYNSHYREKIINNNFRYIDWSEGLPSPKILVTADLQKLKESTAFFARKFDKNVDNEIFKLIDSELLGVNHLNG